MVILSGGGGGAKRLSREKEIKTAWRERVKGDRERERERWVRLMV